MTDSSFACALLAFCDWRPGLIARDFAPPASAARAVVAASRGAAPPIVVYLPYFLLNFKCSLSHLYTVPILSNFACAVTGIREICHAPTPLKFLTKLCLTNHQPVEYNQLAGRE